jgi:CHAT domain-containing protein
LRIRLRVEAEAIASLPLEFMYRKAGGYFLALNPDTVLSRYLQLPWPAGRVRWREGPLHVLTIISSPKEEYLTSLDAAAWETLIRDALAPLAQSQITLTVVKHATLKAINAALLEQKPDIVQFVGHGQYKKGKGYVALVDAQDGQAKWLDAERFANIFLGHQDHLGLISLATCESGKSDDPQGFVGIAPKLVQRGVPAVIAMQYDITIETAKVFFEDFYTSIAAKKSVDWAVQSARKAISQEFGLANRAFATPVLYMRAEDGKIF